MTTSRTTNYARAADGAYVGYQTMGAGDADLLISSYGSISIDSFDEQPQLAHFLDCLASFARVVLFDWRGVGLSDPKPVDAAPDLPHSTSDIAAVIDALGTQPTLLAWLNSGPPMLTFAAQHPEQVRSLLLVNTIAKLVRAPGFEFGLPPHMAESFEKVAIDPGGPSDTPRWIALHAPSMIGDDAFARWWDDGGRRGASPTTAHRAMRGLVAADVRPLLPQIAVPTLVLHSRDCQWYAVDHGRFLADAIPGARLVELPSRDTPPFTEAADAFIEEIEEFVTGERHVHEPARELMTVLFTDIVGSTRQLSELGDRRWREVLDEHDAFSEREVRRHRGRVVKTTGDGLLAVFDSPARAIRCAVALVQRPGIEVRAGLHTGEVELRGADIGGFAVHVGSRVSAEAAAGEVLVSRTVADLVAGSGFVFEERGERELKGLPGSWPLFAVSLPA